MTLATSLEVSAANPIGQEFAQTHRVGPETLVLSGCGTREILWTDVYRAALYLPRPSRNTAVILSDDTPKSMILHAVYDGTYPDDMPDDWHDRLRGEVDYEVLRATRNLFARLEQGDTIELSYTPAAGTVMRHNDHVVLEGEPHDTMATFLELWIGSDPISDNLRRLLLAGTCD